MSIDWDSSREPEHNKNETATHSSAASSSGGQQAACKAVTKQQEVNILELSLQHSLKMDFKMRIIIGPSDFVMLYYRDLLYLVVSPEPHNIIGQLEMNPLQPQIFPWRTQREFG